MDGEMIGEQEIDSPTDLAAILNHLRKALATGALVQIWREDAVCGTDTRLQEIPPTGPWDDYLELYFPAPDTGAEFRLSVETYHGVGGSFEDLG